MHRPLNAFSDFIVGRLPAVLEGPKGIVASEAEKALASLTEGIIERAFGSSEHALARYDLKMLEWSLYHSDIQSPQALVELVDLFASDQCAGLTYEELILTNPKEDMRLFTRGKCGEMERLFYMNHRQVEDSLTVVIANAEHILAHHSLDRFQEEAVRSELATVIAKTLELAAMPDGLFAEFRKYYKSHLGRGMKGPSGAFSAKIPALELLYRGDALPEERFAYIDDNRLYFPQCDRDLLDRAIAAARGGATVRSMARARGAEESPVIACFDEFFGRWRKAHLQAVAQQLPEVFKGSDVGTSGETDVKKFLRNRMQPV